MEMPEKRILISKVNDIIKSAIYYGGDSGGAYFNESDRGDLIKTMEQLRIWGLGDAFAIGYIDNVPLFFEKIGKENEK